MSKQLTEVTRELLQNRPRVMTLPSLCEKLDLPRQWLSDFNRGVRVSNDADRVQKLYEFLSGKELLAE